MPLSRKVDKFLKSKAKLNEKSEKIINMFLARHLKTEVYELLGYIESSGAPKHAKVIKEFVDKYETNTLKVDDIKSYLTVFKLHKNSMKEPKETIEQSKNQNAEESNEQ